MGAAGTDARGKVALKKPNGNYGYESVEDLQEVDRSPVIIPADGLIFTESKTPGKAGGL
ncbi:MAG: hypothetical protein WC076_00525 [Terrimicrobiaceae bacterium]|jgi:hypothetical protein|nr:hypothetical protein [Terrimicrobiaceae bacterium]